MFFFYRGRNQGYQKHHSELLPLAASKPTWMERDWKFSCFLESAAPELEV